MPIDNASWLIYTRRERTGQNLLLSKTGSFLFFYFAYILQLYLVAIAIAICYTTFKRDIIMGKKDKLIAKIKSNPKDFTFDEAESLLGYLSFYKLNKGINSLSIN